MLVLDHLHLLVDLLTRWVEQRARIVAAELDLVVLTYLVLLHQPVQLYEVSFLAL